MSINKTHCNNLFVLFQVSVQTNSSSINSASGHVRLDSTLLFITVCEASISICYN